MFFLPLHSGLAIVHFRGCTDSAAWCSSLRELHLIWHKLSCWQLLPAPGDDSWQLGPALDSRSCGRAARPSLQLAPASEGQAESQQIPVNLVQVQVFNFSCQKIYCVFPASLFFAAAQYISFLLTRPIALHCARHGAQSFVYSVEQRARAWVKNDQPTQSLHCLGCRQETLRSLIFKI